MATPKTYDSTPIVNYVLGIDLGTSNSVVALMKEGADTYEVLSDVTWQKLIPSVVHFTGSGVVAGTSAKSKISQNHKGIVFDSKRLLTKTLNEADALNLKSNWPFGLKTEKSVAIEKLSITVNVEGVDHRSYYPEEISAHVLLRLKRMAEAHIDGIMTRVVICVPANFGIIQKEATKLAAIIAGFEKDKIILINEQTAAAIAFCSDLAIGGGTRSVLVYDLGGGTFDVSLVSFDEGKVIIKGTGGNPQLGGQDFDSNMMRDVVDRLNILKPGTKLTPRQSQTLRKDCELAKIDLVDRPNATVIIEGILDDGEDLSHTFTREDFVNLNIVKFRNTLRVVDDVLEMARTNKEQIDNVILVGGSTKILAIRSMIEEYFARPITKGVNPDEAVAIGAVLYAASITHPDRSIRTFDLFDVASNHIGIAMNDGSLSVLIPKNEKLKAYSIPTPYTTVNDNQDSMLFEVFEGMNVVEATKNHLVGSFLLDDLPKGRAGNVAIIVTLSLDEEDLLTAEAEVKSTGVRKKIQMRMLEHLSDKTIGRLQTRCSEESCGKWSPGNGHEGLFSLLSTDPDPQDEPLRKRLRMDSDDNENVEVVDLD